MGLSPSVRRGVLSLACALAAVLLGTAGAGLPLRTATGNPLRWGTTIQQPNVKDGLVTWYVDPRGSITEPPGETVERDAMAEAAAAWNALGIDRIGLAEDVGRIAYGPSAVDRVNYFSWIPYELGPFTLAVTLVQSNNGVISDTDMIFNDTPDFVLWSTTEIGQKGLADVTSVAAHELGHVLGLDHSPITASTMSAVQYVGSINSRTLSHDDLGGLTLQYDGPPEQDRGAIHGLVRVGSSGTRRGVVVYALDVRTLEPVGCAFTGDDGRFRIRSLPLGSYFVAAFPIASTLRHSPWWAKAPLNLSGSVLEDATRPGSRQPRFVEVRPGYPEVDHDLRVDKAAKKGDGEPDGGPTLARPLPLRTWAAGAFEEPLDEDWYRIPTEGRNAIDVRLKALGLGSAADGDLALFAEDGVTELKSVLDNRPRIDPQWQFGPQGSDQDADITAFVPPGSATILARVRVQPHSEIGGPGAFYLITAMPSAGVPDARRTTASMTPASVRAGSAGTVRFVAWPRDYVGDAIPSDATVVVHRGDGGGTVTLLNQGDGSWAGDMPIPATPGYVGYDLEVDAPLGEHRIVALATLAAAGAPDYAQSHVEVLPRRIEADGVAVARVRFLPRDGFGRSLGDGQNFSVVTLDGPSGLVGTTASLGAATYEAPVKAPTTPGSLRVEVTLDGAPTGIVARVGFGFDLRLVAADLGAEATATAGIPGLSRSIGSALGRTGVYLGTMVAAHEKGDAPTAAKEGVRAVKSLLLVASRGPFFGGDDGATELAEALRRRARSLIDPLRILVPDPKAEKALGKARAHLARAEAAMAANDPRGAAIAIARALNTARTLL